MTIVYCAYPYSDDDDPNIKYVRSLISSARFLILDGQELVSLQLIQIISTILRTIRLDNVFSASWCHHIQVQLFNLLHLSKFSYMDDLEQCIKIIHYSEILFRKRINYFLGINRTKTSIMTVQHTNGCEAERLLHSGNESKSTCLFAEFTQSVYSFLRLAPNSIHGLIKSFLYSTVSCCCIPVEHILSSIPFNCFDILPRLLKKCDQSNCPRCSGKEMKPWIQLEKFYSPKTSTDWYKQNLFHLSDCLPLGGSKVLLEKIILPMLEEKLTNTEDSNSSLSEFSVLSAAAGQAMKSISIAPNGLFGFLNSLLDKSTRTTRNFIIPICVQSLQMVALNNIDRIDKLKLSEDFFRLVMQHLNCIEYSCRDRKSSTMFSNQSFVISSEYIRLQLESKFWIHHFYKCCINSTSFKNMVFETDGIHDILQALLDRGMKVIGDPNQLFTTEEEYLSVATKIKLPTRVQLFSEILSLFTFFTFKKGGTSSIRQFEISTLPEIRFNLVRNLKLNENEVRGQTQCQNWIEIWIEILKSSLHPENYLTSSKTMSYLNYANHEITDNIPNRDKSFEKSGKSSQGQSARQSGSENTSGYEASSEEEQNNSNTPNFLKKEAIPTIAHPVLIKFAFYSFAEFWNGADRQDPNLTECLVEMLKYLIQLFKLDKNVAQSADNDVINVILEKYSFILDTRTNEEASGICNFFFETSATLFEATYFNFSRHLQTTKWLLKHSKSFLTSSQATSHPLPLSLRTFSHFFTTPPK